MFLIFAGTFTRRVFLKEMYIKLSRISNLSTENEIFVVRERVI